MDGTAAERRSARVEEAVAAEAREGARLAVRGVTFAILAIAVLVAVIGRWPEVLFYDALMIGFVAFSHFRLWYEDRLPGRRRVAYALTALQFALLALILLAPNPLASERYPPQLALRFGNDVYLYVMLLALGFSFDPRLVLWGGLVGAVCWGAGVALLTTAPGAVTLPPAGVGVDNMLAAFAEPGFVDLGVQLQKIVVFLIAAALLAQIVRRSRRLAFRQAAMERERANLARYFPPATVDRLARRDAGLSEIRRVEAAVLFVDLVGFTAWAERQPPEAVVAMLRAAHERLARAVFAHHGSLDKFTGDGLMAVFGAHEAGRRDAANAAECALAMARDFKAWNRERAGRGAAPVRLSIGLHYGPVVVGDIGTERRMELTVLGDTVNVASRLERLSRRLGQTVVASAVAVTKARQQGAAGLEAFAPAGAQRLPGRTASVEVSGAGAPPTSAPR